MFQYIFGLLLITYVVAVGCLLWLVFGMNPIGAALLAIPSAATLAIGVAQVIVLLKGLLDFGNWLTSLTFKHVIRGFGNFLAYLPVILIFIALFALLGQCVGNDRDERPCIQGRYGDC